MLKFLYKKMFTKFFVRIFFPGKKFSFSKSLFTGSVKFFDLVTIASPS